jgi:hypothetical protein
VLLARRALGVLGSFEYPFYPLARDSAAGRGLGSAGASIEADGLQGLRSLLASLLGNLGVISALLGS